MGRPRRSGEVAPDSLNPTLERRFNILSICSLGIVTGNTWSAVGGSVTVAIYNGGPPGTIYEFITVAVFYWLISASIAELASAMPSSAGVYHWASITAGPRYGRITGWFAGWWNFCAWLVAAASLSLIIGEQTVQMYALFHPELVPAQWHVFVSYLVVTWLCSMVVLFGNRFLPSINSIGLFFILAGVLITVIVCAILPSKRGSYASSKFVWRDWTNATGYTSNGLVFCMGMLNGAFAVGTPDCVSHVAEEIPKPETNVPKAIFAQAVIGFITALSYLITIFYAISNLDDVLSTSIYPVAEIYHQATGSASGALGLLIVIFVPSVCTCIGCYITAGRMLWTLGRANATPWSRAIGAIHPVHRNPFNATAACSLLCTALGTIYLGSTTAFSAFIDSFVTLACLSYLAAILPHLIRGRRQWSSKSLAQRPDMHGGPGPFSMKGWVGFIVNGISCAYMIVFTVIYCFPYTKAFDAQSMNYSSAIIGGLTVIIALWWLARKDQYGTDEEELEGISHIATRESQGLSGQPAVALSDSQKQEDGNGCSA